MVAFPCHDKFKVIKGSRTLPNSPNPPPKSPPKNPTKKGNKEKTKNNKNPVEKKGKKEDFIGPAGGRGGIKRF